MTNGTKLALRLTGAVVAVGAAGTATIVSTVAQGPGLNIEVSQCIDLEVPLERLACYDNQVEAVRNAGRATTPTPAAVTPAAAGSAQAAADSSESVPPDILAKVAELRETVPNSYLITLDNGQVWRQTTPQSYALRVGLDVRIYYSPRWRSYRLTNEALRRYIQVERVR